MTLTLDKAAIQRAKTTLKRKAKNITKNIPYHFGHVEAHIIKRHNKYISMKSCAMLVFSHIIGAAISRHTVPVSKAFINVRPICAFASLKEGIIKMIKEMRSSESNKADLLALFGIKPFLCKLLFALSGGTNQKVNVQPYLCLTPPMVILDQPTTGLDPQAMIHAKAVIRQFLKTTLFFYAR